MKHKYSKMPQSCTEIIRCYLIRRNIDGRFLYSWDPTIKTVEACFPKLRGQLSLYERVDSVNWRATWPTTRTGIETTSA